MSSDDDQSSNSSNEKSPKKKHGKSSDISPTATTSIANRQPHISWSDSQSKAYNAIEGLNAVLPKIPRSLATSKNPASSLLIDLEFASLVSQMLRRPNSGAVDDNLCAWLYETFQTSQHDLHLVVLRFLPILAGVYLTRATLNKPLAGFESVLLAIYAHETSMRNGQAVSVSIPDLSHCSIYHEAKQAPKNETELHLAVITPSLEPHGSVRSTRRARIVGVALELYYTKVALLPVGSKMEFCEFCKIWSGQGHVVTQPDSKPKEIEQESQNWRRKGRIDLTWELLQPILRVVGHCLMTSGKDSELYEAAMDACKCLYARALHDINPKAILAIGSLLKNAKIAIESADQCDYTEIEVTNVIAI